MLNKLITQLVELDALRSSEVEAAIRAVPRHLFVPGVPLAQAYAAEDSPVVKRDEHGVIISSVSAVRVQAMMLEQAEVRPGMRVLEIGSGGYNAALAREIVGPDGEVTTIDIDQDVTERARTFLDAAGYRDVRVLCVDGEFGAAEHAPFDRIIVTVGAWDVPPAWMEQLAEDGRLVVPLRVRGLTRSIVFERKGSHLVSRGYELCGFVPMQGVGENRQRLALLHGEEVGLRLDDGQQADADALNKALMEPRVEAWPGAKIGPGVRFDGLHLWLATALPDFGLLTAKQEAADRGIVTRSACSPFGTPTAIGRESFAYLTMRPVTRERKEFEFGAFGHGPVGRKLAEQMAEHIRSWDGGSLRALFEAHPAGTLDEYLPKEALVLDKRHTRITISWP